VYVPPTINWLKNKLSKLLVDGSCKTLATGCLDGVKAQFDSRLG